MLSYGYSCVFWSLSLDINNVLMSFISDQLFSVHISDMFTFMKKRMFLKCFHDMVTKHKFQDMIFSFNLNLKCRSWIFCTHYYDCAIKNSKIKIKNRCYSYKLKKGKFWYFQALLNSFIHIYKVQIFDINK